MHEEGTVASPAVVPGFVASAPRAMAAVFEPRTPDRTAAMEGRAPSPLPYLTASVDTLVRLGATHFGVPCNSAHHFLYQAIAAGWQPPIPIIDMIEESVRAAARAGARVVGVLATSGTVRAGLYQAALRRQGLESVVPASGHEGAWAAAPPLTGRMPAGVLPPSLSNPLPADLFERVVASQTADFGEQDGLVMEAIYGEAGIKAGYTSGMARQFAERAATNLVRRDGVDALVLGCTELPLVLREASLEIDGRTIPVFDSTAELAKALLARDGVPGIAGGLGPEATIDLIRKMHGPPDLVAVLEALFRSTLALLQARRDQEHLVLFARTGPDSRESAVRLVAAGATLLVAAESAAGDLTRALGSAPVPVVVGGAAEVAALVVRAAGFERCVQSLPA